MTISLNRPLNDTIHTTPIFFNCSALSSGNNITNITLRMWNSSIDIYYNETNLTSGFYNESTHTVDFTYDDTFHWNCIAYNNVSESRWASSNFTFTTSLTSPAINLDTPTDKKFLNNETNIYFNFTATDGNGLDACELWGNWTGVWHMNFTWYNNPLSGVQNFTVVNVTDGDAEYRWNVWCNDTLDNGGFRFQNFTFTLDTTLPNTTINSIKTLKYPNGLF